MQQDSFVHTALPGRVVFGAGTRRRVAEELDQLEAKRVLLLHAPEEEAYVEELSELLGDRVVGRCTRVAQHVPEDCAEEARSAALEAGADSVLTLGGGSATGLGKAVVLAHDLRFVAIPTTYAGSEMTPIWGMSSGREKHTGRDMRVLPDVVIYDPELTLTLPPHIAGPSGMNAIAHCVEATYGPGHSPITTLLALEGIRALCIGIPKVVERPDDLEGRGQTLYGAYLAGTALAVGGTAIHHKTCHVLGGMFNLGHGEMNSVILPHALRYNEPAISDAYAEIAAAVGREDAAMAFYDLSGRIGSPRSLAEIGMPEEGIEEAVPRVVAAVSENVRPPDVSSIRAFLEDAYEGRPPRTP